MSKSNQEIWDEGAFLSGWGGLEDMGPWVTDFAEAVREDQRQVCATKYDSWRNLSTETRGDAYLVILNAGKVAERRELLGKALYDSSCNRCGGGVLLWGDLPELSRETWCVDADAVRKALEKENADG